MTPPALRATSPAALGRETFGQRPNFFHVLSLPRIRTNSAPFLLPGSRGLQVTEIHVWWSQRAEQLSLSQGSGNSASVVSSSPAGAWIERVPRGGCSEQATVRKRDRSAGHTGMPWTVNSRPV